MSSAYSYGGCQVSTARWESAAKVLLPSWTLVYTTLRLHRFGANRSCRPVPACAASSGYAPRACRCPRSTACGPAPSPDAPARCAPVLEGDATHRDATATRIGAPSSQGTIDSVCVVMGRTAILLSLRLVLASPQRRSPIRSLALSISALTQADEPSRSLGVGACRRP
jgi:hypothetical protein